MFFSYEVLWNDFKREEAHPVDAPLIIDETGVFLVGSLELFQEAYVIFREKAEVFHLIFEVGDALDAHAKCIAFILGGVNAVSFEHVGVYCSRNYGEVFCCRCYNTA